MFNRKTEGSIVCPSCGSLVGVNDEKCYSCGRANPGLWGFGPAIRALGRDMGFVPLVLGASIVIYGLALFASGGNILGGGGMNLLSPSTGALLWFGASGAVPVFYLGNWWTVLSAGWLHAGLIHILFNMMAVRNVGPGAVEIIGPGRTVIVWVVSGAVGFLLSSTMGAYGPRIPFLSGATITVGASASIFGLIGALAHYGRVSGSALVRETTKGWIISGLMIGFLLPGIDNWAHAGGFLGGYATSMFFNPLTRERGDHIIIALACLLATFAAVGASLLQGPPRF